MGPTIQIVGILLIASVSVTHGDLNSIVNRLLAKVSAGYDETAVTGIRGSNVYEDDGNRQNNQQNLQQRSRSRYENRDNEQELYHNNRNQKRQKQYHRSQRFRNDLQGINKNNLLMNDKTGAWQGSNQYATGVGHYFHQQNDNYRGGSQYNRKLDKYMNIGSQLSRGDRYDSRQDMKKASNLTPLIKSLLKMSKELAQQDQNSLPQRDRYNQRDNYNQNKRDVFDQRDRYDQVQQYRNYHYGNYDKRQQDRFDQPYSYDQRVQDRYDGRDRFDLPLYNQHNKQNYNRGIGRINSVSRSPVIKSLLRISKDINCAAQEECKDECGSKTENECEDRCEQAFECEEEESGDCDNDYDQCNSGEKKNPSTHGVVVDQENEKNCFNGC